MEEIEDYTKEDLIELVRIKDEQIKKLREELEIYMELAKSLAKKYQNNDQY